MYPEVYTASVGSGKCFVSCRLYLNVELTAVKQYMWPYPSLNHPLVLPGVSSSSTVCGPAPGFFSRLHHYQSSVPFNIKRRLDFTIGQKKDVKGMLYAVGGFWGVC